MHILADAARERHGTAVRSVLVYGSCLRDSVVADRVVDLYLIVDSYRAVHANPLLRWANALLPPNVYYLEVPFEGEVLRAKYALVSTRSFARLTTARAFHPYFWARFAQPCALAYARDADAEEAMVDALAASIETLARTIAPLLPQETTARAFWTRAFMETYRTELRAEGPERAATLVSADAQRYGRISQLLFDRQSPDPDQPLGGVLDRAGYGKTRRAWFTRRCLGKPLSVLRLMKAAFTFDNGAAYLLWKIERHSGVTLTLTPWQRRHPILASSVVFWQLYRRGAFR